MSSVLFQVVRVNQHVIHVHYWKFIQEVMEYIVSVMLESFQGLAQSKWHHYIFERAVATLEHRLPFFTRCNPQAVISISYVKFGEILCLPDLL